MGDTMSEESKYYETPKVRCLVYQRRFTDDLYLMLCGVEHCPPEYYYHTEDRPGYHLHVVLEGKGILSVNKVEKELHFGQMFVTKPGEDTWYRADSENPWVYCWMTFDGNLALECLEKSGFTKGVNVLDCHIDPQRFYSIVAQVLEVPEVSPANVVQRTGLLFAYITSAIESYYKGNQNIKRTHDYPSEQYIKYAADFIRANYATARVSDVARYIGIHRSYLTNIFKAKMGISPQEYLMKCKLNRASRLLMETDNPIQEISRQVGYDNPLTFSKTFKNFYGVSPRAYREQRRSQEEEKET